MHAFKLVEREVGPQCREIGVEGELDLAVAELLKDALDGVDSDCPQILIGLENCEFIDSTGIAVIVNAHRRFSEEGRRIALCSPNSQVLRVLSITGLTTNGLVFDDAAEALSTALLGAAENGQS
jgi:anti-sigma B factor antagonist